MIQPEKIIIADDHPLFRQALLGTLKAKLNYTQWLEAETVSELDEQLLAHNDSDLLLLDLNIPGAHGFSTLIHVRNHFPQIPVVVVSAHEDHRTISKAMSYGAAGYVPKSTPVEEMRTAVKSVLEGKVWVPEDVDLASDDDDEVSQLVQRFATLTPQQLRVLMMLREGLLNKQIAYELSVSEATVKAHVSAILQKLGVESRTQAVIAASRIDGDQWNDQTP